MNLLNLIRKGEGGGGAEALGGWGEGGGEEWGGMQGPGRQEPRHLPGARSTLLRSFAYS